MNYTAVGAFVVVLSAVFVAAVLWLASGGPFQKKVDLYLAIENESVAGLSPNAPVKYSGVDVGKVQAMHLAHDNPEQVRLIFAINRGTPIKEDTVAVLKTQGLTGIAYVELTGGSRDSPPLRATAEGRLPEIQTKPSLSARLENMLTSVLAKLDSTSSGINSLLSEENKAAFKSALADIAVVSHTVAARKDTLDAGIASAARTFDNGARLTDELRAQLGPLVDRVGKAADAVDKMGTEVALAGSKTGKTAEELGADVKRITVETMPELQRLLGEMNVLSASLRRLSEKIEGSPGGLLLGRSPVPEGPGEKAAR